MPRNPYPKPYTRKTLLLSDALWAEVEHYRATQGLRTESDAIRQMLQQHLAADAPDPLQGLNGMEAEGSLDPTGLPFNAQERQALEEAARLEKMPKRPLLRAVVVQWLRGRGLLSLQATPNAEPASENS